MIVQFCLKLKVGAKRVLYVMSCTYEVWIFGSVFEVKYMLYTVLYILVLL